MAYGETQEVRQCVLVLDEEEAGYLRELLSAHVGGALTLDDEPLGRIRVALAEADVPRITAYNAHPSSGITAVYATPAGADADRPLKTGGLYSYR